MELTPSLGTVHVHSTHYYGLTLPVEVRPADLITDIGKYANSSILQPHSFAFRKSSAQTWPELIDHSVTVTEMGNYFVFSSSNRKDAYLKQDWQKYGYVHNPDESMDRMDGWIGATVGSHAIEYVKPFEEIGLFELPEHVPDYSKFGMTDVNVPIRQLVGTVPINKVGEYVSRIANLEEDLRGVIYSNDIRSGVGFNPETEAYLEFLIEKGLGPGREIEAIGVENLEGAIARTIFNDGSAVLVASKGIYDRSLAIAQRHGLGGDEAVRFAKRAVWYHELYHVFDHREGLSQKKIEIDVGESLAEFFGTRAYMLEGKLAEYYRALAEWGQNYAQGWRKGSINRPRSTSVKSRVESLTIKYATEAINKGMSGEETREYVASKLEEELGKNENPEAESNSDDSKSDSSDDCSDVAEDSGSDGVSSGESE